MNWIGWGREGDEKSIRDFEGFGRKQEKGMAK
jgi:hypothetical protein